MAVKKGDRSPAPKSFQMKMPKLARIPQQAEECGREQQKIERPPDFDDLRCRATIASSSVYSATPTVNPSRLISNAALREFISCR